MPTPETSPGAPSSPELVAVPPLEKALRFDSLAELWQKTKDVYYGHHSKDDATGSWGVDDASVYNTEVDEAIRAYLSGHGLDESSTEFTRLEGRLRRLSFDHMFTRRWKYGDWVDNDDHSKGLKPGTSGESRVRKMQLAFTGRDLEEEARVASTTNPEDEEEEDVKVTLETMRETYSRKLAERSKKMGLFEGKHTKAEMKALREEMAEYIGGIATEMMDDLEAQSIPKDVWVDKVEEFIQTEMAGLVTGMENARAEDFQKRSRVVKFGLEKWASWSNPTIERSEGESRLHHIGRTVLANITNWNSLKNNFKKAGVFMAVGGLVGGGTALALGLVSGGAAVAGSAAFLATKIARGLAGAHLDSAAGAETIASRQAVEIATRWGAIPEATHYELLELAENMAEGYRKQNRNRLIGGIGLALVAGGGTSALIHNFFDFNTLYGLIGEKMQGMFGHGSQPAPSIPGPGAPSSTGSTGGMVGHEIPSDKPDIGGAHHPGTSKGEGINDYIKEHGAAQHIDNGEGWDQTMQELGIKSKDWHELLQKVGPKLHDIRYGDVRAAYWDDQAHEWRINMTGNHKMSPEALRLLVEEANKEGALKHSLDLTGHAASASPEAGVETHGVKLWNGAAPEQVLQKEYPGLTGRQAFVDINELYDKLGPKNVFDRATLSEHGHNNIWIDQSAGTVKLTPEAQTIWDQMHPEDKALAQLITEGRGSGINIVTHGEHWTNVLDKLKQAGITDVAKDKYGSVLRQLWPQIKNLEYNDGTPVASLDRHGNLIMNESPTKVLHPEALRRLVRLLYKNNYKLAA